MKSTHGVMSPPTPIRRHLVARISLLLIGYVVAASLSVLLLLRPTYRLSVTRGLEEALQLAIDSFAEDGRLTIDEISRVERERGVHVTFVGPNGEVRYDTLSGRRPPVVGIESGVSIPSAPPPAPGAIRIGAEPPGLGATAPAAFIARGRTADGGTLIFRQPVAPVAEGSWFVFFLLLSIAFPLLGVALLLGRAIAGHLATPIAGIGARVQQMAALDFAEDWPASEIEEINTLSRTLATVSGFLERTVRELKALTSTLSDEVEHERRLRTMRSEFVAAASHDLKTPIAVIQGYASALQDEITGGRSPSEYAAIIEKETDRLAEVVSRLLRLSQVERPSSPLQPTSIAAASVAQAVRRRFSERARREAVNLSVRADDGDIIVDIELIHRALDCLIENALEHTPAGGDVDVSIERRQSDPAPPLDGDLDGAADRTRLPAAATARPDAPAPTQQIDHRVLITVANTGSRIEGDASRLWEGFYRGDASRTRAGDTVHLGIGLATVRSIAEQHGGETHAENTPGGVMFSIILPDGFSQGSHTAVSK